MADVPPQLVPTVDAAAVGTSPEATKERQKRREAEKDALVNDTHQREALLLEHTQQLFTHLQAYLRGELSSTQLVPEPVSWLPQYSNPPAARTFRFS